MSYIADLARMDMQSFPTEDPKAAAKRHKELEKQRKEDERARKQPSKRAQALGEKPTPKAKAEPAELNDVDRERVILTRKITQYFAKLKHKISVSKPRAMPTDVAKLRQLCLAIETDLSASGGVDACATMYLNGCAAVERLAPLLPWDIQLSGPAASFTGTVMANKAQWDDLITEVAIQHSEWFMVSGFKRLLMMTGQMAMQVNAANRAARSDGKASEDLKAKAEDL